MRQRSCRRPPRDDVAAYPGMVALPGGAAAWMAYAEFDMEEMLALARENFRRAIATGLPFTGLPSWPMAIWATKRLSPTPI